MENKIEKKENTQSIWILDDDASICEALKIVLDDFGYNAESFDVSNKLLDRLKSERPDLVIMDILLGNEDGTTIAKNLKTNKKYKSIPIILMSANSTDKKKLLASKANSFIKKPFDIYNLINEVKLII